MKFAAGISEDEGGYPLIGAGGFRDMTRIAASSPEMWVEIVRTNRAAVADVMTRFEEALRRTREAVASSDWEGLKAGLTDARRARYALGEKPGVSPVDLIELQIPVPDRPGVLAEITTTVGEAGINIEDIDIVHSSEGGRGTIHLALSGEGTAIAAAEVIERRGYRVHRSHGPV
jgi:prephenate dehydrogenase